MREFSPHTRQRVPAWGGSTAAESWIVRPRSVDDVRAALADAQRSGITVGLRGAGQSYGDAALASDGMSLDLSDMAAINHFDADTGIIDAEPGVTIAQLWRAVIGDGWWPAVVPGTMAVSLGGAAAMNIHGKNNWKVGPIGDHIRALDVVLPSGDLVTCSRSERADLFHAIIGGFGMLGVIVRIEVAQKRIYSGLIDVEAVAMGTMREMLECIEARMADADYLVGWVDTLATGNAVGRGLIHEARQRRPGADTDPARSLEVSEQELPPTILGVLPKSVVWRFMRPFMHNQGVRLVNAAKYVQGRLGHGHRFSESHAGFHFLLDYVPNWRRAYGPGGLIQFQSFVPAAAAENTFRSILETARAAGVPPYLGVLKRHREDAFLMTHAVDGYSLALDFRVTSGNRRQLWELTRTLARVVADAGGRFYPAKDSTLDAETYQRALGAERLAAFRTLKQEYDPGDLLQTDLSRRLLMA